MSTPWELVTFQNASLRRSLRPVSGQVYWLSPGPGSLAPDCEPRAQVHA